MVSISGRAEIRLVNYSAGIASSLAFCTTGVVQAGDEQFRAFTTRQRDGPLDRGGGYSGPDRG